MSILRAVARIGEILQQRYACDVFPREALEALLKPTGCEQCRLFLVVYKDTLVHSLSTIHVVPDYKAEVSRLELGTFDAAVPTLLANPDVPHLVLPFAGGHTAHFPVRLDGHLCALLSLDLPEGTALKRRMDVARACLPMITLWFAGANQRKLTQDICNFTREPLYMMQTDGVLAMWNHAMTALSGWSEEEMLGKGDYHNAIPFYGYKRPTVPHLLLNPDPPFEKRNYVEFRREDEIVHAVTFLPKVPEEGAYVSFKAQRLYTINGMIYAAILSLRDLTQMRQLEMDLHKLQFIGRMVNDLSENGMVLLNQEGVSYFNDNMLKILDLPPGSKLVFKEVMGLAARASRYERDKVIAFTRQILKAEEPSPPFVEFTVYYDDGKSRDLRCHACIEAGAEATAMLIFTDITRERSLITQAKENEMKVMRADRLSSLGILSAGIAHEIAQPLGTIKVLADTFLFGLDQGWPVNQDNLSEKFRLISKHVDRISRIIDGVRVFSRDENEQDDSTCDLNEAVRNVMDIIERHFSTRGIRVTVDYCKRSVPVSCALSRMEQVIMNLLLNARQSLDNCVDHGYKDIVLTTRCEDGTAYVLLKDNGTGVSVENLERIFDPFFTTKEIGQGTGLGLSICKAIINGAGGNIEVWNNASRGCTFQIDLPILAIAPTVEARDEGSSH